ncbi:MAG TPA: hypothetical protein VN213_01810 [Solirubrobacteraceae bacterium]|nr:hypothetical protein [Solirubrobacteraceae bacterium]
MLLPAVLLLCAALAAPAGAAVRVGIGDQDPSMFSQPTFKALKVKRVRYIVPWDWFKDAGQNAQVTAFMTAARAARADVLVHFTARRGCYRTGNRYSRARVCRAPSVRTYSASVRRFRREYRWVRTYGAWNEANHISQPIYRNPRRAAQYFLALRRICPRCTIVAADVLDIRNMGSYLRGFLRHARGRARIFGLHNYGDVNRLRQSFTRQILSTVPGQVWATETGGIYSFRPNFAPNLRRQAARTRYMFRLFDRYDTRRPGMRSRLTRLYNYQWSGAEAGAAFDAGLVNPDGSARPAYRTFLRLARRLPR